MGHAHYHALFCFVGVISRILIGCFMEKSFFKKALEISYGLCYNAL